MAEEFFFGCPVLHRFIRTTEPHLNWDLYDSSEWDDLKNKIESERPVGSVLRRRALLCVAFAFEEIAFSLKKLKHHDAAAVLREPPGPIRGPDDLNGVIERLDEVTEDVIAQLVNDKMIGDPLGAKQVSIATRESIQNAVNIAKSSTRFLQAQWNNPSELSMCGAELAHVLETLKVAFDRRLAYLKTIFGETTNG